MQKRIRYNDRVTTSLNTERDLLEEAINKGYNISEILTNALMEVLNKSEFNKKLPEKKQAMKVIQKKMPYLLGVNALMESMKWSKRRARLFLQVQKVEGTLQFHNGNIVPKQ